MRSRRLLVIALAAMSALAACSSDQSDDLSTTDATVPDYADEASAFADAADDRSLPPIEPTDPIGSYGFSRYVYNNVDGEVMATLIEVPRGEQTRCQEVDLDCSYTELKALYD